MLNADVVCGNPITSAPLKNDKDSLACHRTQHSCSLDTLTTVERIKGYIYQNLDKNYFCLVKSYHNARVIDDVCQYF